MILQVLTRYYEDLLQQGEIAAPGWGPAKISFALCLDRDGQVLQVIPIMEEVAMGKKTVLRPQSMILPSAVKRTVGVASISCGTIPPTCWVLTRRESRSAAGLLSRRCKPAPYRIDGVDSPAAKAILTFSIHGSRKKRWNTPPCPDSMRQLPQAEIYCSGWMAAILTRTQPSARRGSGIGTAPMRTL